MIQKFKATGLFWLWISAVVIFIDQLTKKLIVNAFEYYESLQILPFFNLTYVRNKGAAFSFLHDAGGWQLWFFSAIAFGVSALLSVWLLRQPRSFHMLSVAYSLVIGGAIGNVIDRIFTDMLLILYTYIINHSTTAFNVADMAITVGAALIIIDALRWNIWLKK